MTVPPIDPIQPNEGQTPPPNFQYQPPVGNPNQTSYGAGKTINVLAVLGFALAVTCTGCGVISLVLSILGNSQINREPQRYSGKGFAIAGIVISVLTIIALPILAILGMLEPILNEANPSY